MKTTLALAKALKEYRIAKDLSQEELAEICNLDRTYISLLERAKRNPSLDIVFTLAKGLGITPSTLIKTIEKKNNENH